MHPRPPPEWYFKQSTLNYETRFRRKVPQWVQALGGETARSLIGMALRLNWKIHAKVLIAEESYSGSESLWSQQKTRLDFQTDHLIKNRALDLMNLPFDPAQAAMKSCLKKGGGN